VYSAATTNAQTEVAETRAATTAEAGWKTATASVQGRDGREDNRKTGWQ
jgi:hypothetical protein